MNLKNVFTERDNATPCPVRVLAVLGGLEFLGLAAMVALRSSSFDMQAFGVGLGVVLTAIGAAISAKATTEGKAQ
jgi:hypothetical protein